MGRMIFDLTDEDKGALEKLRKQRGLRSHAEVLRELIRQAISSGLPTPERQAEMKTAVAAFRGVTANGEPLPERGAYQKKGSAKK